MSRIGERGQRRPRDRPEQTGRVAIAMLANAHLRDGTCVRRSRRAALPVYIRNVYRFLRVFMLAEAV